jgi:hypothetical protein
MSIDQYGRPLLRCKLCGGDVWAERVYEKNGVCEDCATWVANELWRAHSGEPHPVFAPEEYAGYFAKLGRPAVKAPISEKLRWQVFERDEFACRSCGSRSFLRADHIVPESKGGPTTLANLQTLCETCNTRKGDRV